MVMRLPKKKSKSPPRIGKKLQDYIDRNPLRRTEFSKILKEARSRKPTGVINIDDFLRSIDVQNKRPVRPRSKVKKWVTKRY